MKLLTPAGVLLFSTNFRKFKLDTESLADLAIEDISRKTLPQDFARNPRIHQCWWLRMKQESTASSG
jgi:23S rRNA (guanine2445-N2)-methyltransferase / 23S rRNA (guanine2069-N7)-methyltransferase